MDLSDIAVYGEHLSSQGTNLLRHVRDATGLAQALAQLVSLAEAGIKSPERPIACQAGCPHCCVLAVTVLPAEAAVIAIRLAEGMPRQERSSVSRRIDNQRLMVRWMDEGERVRRQIPCAFLDGGGSCSIHAFRPLMCRGVTSIDSELCREALDPAEPDGPLSVPMDLVRKMGMDEAFRALAVAMETCGMSTRGMELSAGVHAFLTEPELCLQLIAGSPLPARLWE